MENTNYSYTSMKYKNTGGNGLEWPKFRRQLISLCSVINTTFCLSFNYYVFPTNTCLIEHSIKQDRTEQKIQQSSGELVRISVLSPLMWLAWKEIKKKKEKKKKKENKTKSGEIDSFASSSCIPLCNTYSASVSKTYRI